MAQRVLILILWIFSSPVFAGLFDTPGAGAFVPASQAFAFDFQQRQQTVTLSWQIKPGYYLYRKQISLSPTGATLGSASLPEGEWHHDEFFGNSEIYRQQLTFTVPIINAGNGATINVSWQGCSDRGVCYPPESKVVPLSAVANLAGMPVSNNAASAATRPAPQQSTATAKRPFSPLWALLIGIGIAFTPCVLPMYPLISGIILGAERKRTMTSALFLALLYIQGMALTYTAMGMIVAAIGLPFQAALQHPAVLITLSVLFTLLALPMFGLYTLQLPSSLQTRFTLLSQRQQSGTPAGVFVMGIIAGLICSPCTTAPLSAILLYIAQSGDLTLGGVTLWLYATGMGLPLAAVAVFGHRCLPKSGPWMAHIKVAFGFALLTMPIFLLSRVIDSIWEPRMWSLLGIGFFGWAFITSLPLRGRALRVGQVILLGAALVCARPLQDWVFGATSSPTAPLAFTKVQDLSSLDEALAQAKGSPVMLDIYADWCVSCKELEKYTFSHPEVQRALQHVRLLQVDVTANSAANRALLHQLNVPGLPAILFFNPQGEEQSQSRVTGFINAGDFMAHLQNQPLSATLQKSENDQGEK